MSRESIPESLLPFIHPEIHQRAAEIIRRHSTHPQDIHEFALENLPLSGVRRVLELGCGFGRFSRELARRIAPEAEFLALDSQPANQAPWEASLGAIGRRGTFLCRCIDERLEFSAGEFDLVAASYSLYFFPAIVPEVARVLAPHGVFLAITHSRGSMHGLFELAGLDPGGSPHDALLARFSAENGHRLLAPHFSEIVARPYPNRLRFDPESLPAFLEYARFKLPLLASAGADERLLARLEDRARASLSRAGEIVIAKDDVVFTCRGPRPARAGPAGGPPCH